MWWFLAGIGFLVGLGLGINYCRAKYLARKAAHHSGHESKHSEVVRDDDLDQLGTFVDELEEVTNKLRTFTEEIKSPYPEHFHE